MPLAPTLEKLKVDQLLQPTRAIFLGFLAAVLTGTGLLLLPNAKQGPGSASVIEALFTAVSAVCVTGLVVVDTPTYWTTFGEAVILVLIQIGGFGVMTFASVIGLTVMRRLSLRSKLSAAAERSAGIEDIGRITLGVVKISLIIEASVAVILTLRFWLHYDLGLGRSLWFGVFHAVSAFNNAGFGLYTDSLMSFTSDPIITVPITLAVILGGIGFPVIAQLRKSPHTPRLWSMNTRIVLWGTVLLLVLGGIFVTAMEWNNPQTLGSMSWPDRVVSGFVQSAQTRTAGYNNLDIAQMDSATWLGMDVLMFIGAGPAGTGGGIKITTFAVLYFLIVAEIRGDAAVNVFGKRLSRSVHRQAISVALLAVALVIAGTGLLMLISDFTLDQLLFETISAFATVGLSTGITAQLPTAGKLVLVALMFIGRLGPITFASALALQDRTRLYELPKERPIIG